MIIFLIDKYIHTTHAQYVCVKKRYTFESDDGGVGGGGLYHDKLKICDFYFIPRPRPLV